VGCLQTCFLFLSKQAPVAKIAGVFPRAVPNATLVDRIILALDPFGYGKGSLLATSLCCDEVNRPLERDLQKAFGDHFNMGGLAGFAFGGVTSFCAMASHIPDNGSCLVVYGPHVGVDELGMVGTVNRRGRERGGNCCGSAIAAAAYVDGVYENAAEKAAAPSCPLDAQQTFVGNMLLPHAERLQKAKDKMVELPLALYDAQDALMLKIIAAACSKVPDSGQIALLGGVQINTPDGVSDFFLPLRFEVRNNRGTVIKDLMGYSKI
jgi:hypothetical protein